MQILGRQGTKKIHSRSPPAPTTLSAHSMKRLLPPLLLCAALTASGCHLFSQKGSDPTAQKPHATVATEVETDFMKRWVDHRTGELVAQGTAPGDARKEAAAEFKTRFSYTGLAGGKPPAP